MRQAAKKSLAANAAVSQKTETRAHAPKNYLFTLQAIPGQRKPHDMNEREQNRT